MLYLAGKHLLEIRLLLFLQLFSKGRHKKRKLKDITPRRGADQTQVVENDDDIQTEVGR